MALVGRTLSSYRILEKLGEGGMGVVWKALDTRLEREVAIKVLPGPFASDPERLARFEREAKVLASLNHRNIASIYGIEESDGVRFLVMELAEGEDLAQRLARGPIPVREALDLAHQLARAFDSAHEKGILHRDLKPANVKISREGRVKVLDFGLAKALEPVGPGGDPMHSPTVTSGGTQSGTILGTAAYMSPEQARAQPLDKRSDIWSFGCLLYECLTGQSPFRGDTVTDTLAAIVKSQPDWSALPAETPPRVRELLERCLDKEVRNRLRDIGDARLELQRALGGGESFADSSVVTTGPVLTADRSRRPAASWLAVAALIGAVVGVGLWTAYRAANEMPANAPVTRLSIAFPPDLRNTGWRISPAGGLVGYTAVPKTPHEDPELDINRLYLRSLDSFETREVEGTGGGVWTWSFSPDGRWIAMIVPVSPRSSRGRLMKVPVDGSAPPLAMLDWRDNWWGPILWLPDGNLLFRTAGGNSLLRLAPGAAGPREVAEIRFAGVEADFGLNGQSSTILPDGTHVLGTATTYTPRGFDNHVALLDIETGEAEIVVENGNSPRWSPTGHVLFGRGDSLLAAPFDLDSLAVSGDTVAVLAGMRSLAVYGDTYFDLAADGTLVHWPGGVYGDRRQLFYVNVDGTLGEPWSDDLRFFEGEMDVSTDGRRLAVSICNDDGLYDIWTSSLDRPRLVRSVHETGRDCLPARWTPDVETLLYTCGTTEETVLYARDIEAAGEARSLLSWRSPSWYWPKDFRDGSTLVLDHCHMPEGSNDRRCDLELLAIGGTGDAPPAPEPWLEDAANGAISPDGRWLAYQSDSSGRSEVYLRPIAADGALGREIPVTTNGGGGAWWFPGRTTSPLQLWYGNGWKHYSVDVTTEPALRLSEPVLIADGSGLAGKLEEIDILPDGRKLAVIKEVDEQTPNRLNVVLNWSAELEARLRSRP